MGKVGIFSGLFFVLFSSAAVAWDGVVYDVAAMKPVPRETMFEALSGMEAVALGEKHYTAAVQAAEAAVIDGVVRAAKREGRFTVGWEFLPRTDQYKVRRLYVQYLAGAITAEDFLMKTQGTEKAYVYAPLLETAKRLRGELLGTNLTREEKKPAVQGGLAAMDPKLVPPAFELGGASYLERFAEALGQSPHEAKLQNYFVAQCLTDAWLAETLVKESAHDLRFLVAGSFHVEYHDGAVAELRRRGHADRVRSVLFVDAADHAAGELPGPIKHPKYGDAADYVWFVNEPAGVNP